MEPAVNEQNFPYADTQAAITLRSALNRLHAEKGLSIRSLGKALGYKQATVLSHMASGRVTIPLERAADIAQAVGIPAAPFFLSAVAQRSRDATLLLEPANSSAGFGLAGELAELAGTPLDGLNEEQKQVLREVAMDPRPRRRWLSVNELRVMEAVRRRHPNIASDVLSEADLTRISGLS